MLHETQDELEVEVDNAARREAQWELELQEARQAAAAAAGNRRLSRGQEGREAAVAAWSGNTRSSGGHPEAGGNVQSDNDPPPSKPPQGQSKDRARWSQEPDVGDNSKHRITRLVANISRFRTHRKSQEEGS